MVFISFIFFVQKKSREESHGAGSGVEILQNQPYKEGPGGNGQYTYKIYHIGSHLPGEYGIFHITATSPYIGNHKFAPNILW